MAEQDTIGIVSHDAGGAEILSSYVRREGLHTLLAVEGPALGVFARKLGSISPVTLQQAVEGSSWLLCGTGWQSDLEWRGIALARKLGRRSIAFLDHWMHYRERFERNGVQCLPDEVWAGDEYALRIARQQLSSVPVRLVSNPYFEDARRELASVRSSLTAKSNGPVILYVCEPMREIGLRQYGDEHYFGYTEERALTYFLEHKQAIAANAEVVIRLHPSESKGKYSWAASHCDAHVRFSSGTTLEQDIAGADIIVGCESMAMVIALIGGKRVVTAIPPGGRPCQLPQPGIESLRNLAEARTGG
jgi:hypothetical protein